MERSDGLLKFTVREMNLAPGLPPIAPESEAESLLGIVDARVQALSNELHDLRCRSDTAARGQSPNVQNKLGFTVALKTQIGHVVNEQEIAKGFEAFLAQSDG